MENCQLIRDKHFNSETICDTKLNDAINKLYSYIAYSTLS